MIILAALQLGSFPGNWRMLPALLQPRPLSRGWGMLLVLLQPSSWSDVAGWFFSFLFLGGLDGGCL